MDIQASTVADLLRSRADDERVGLRFEGRHWTWRQLVQHCAQRAAWLASLTSGSDSRPVHVGVLCDNVPEMVFLLGGAALSGNVVVGLNPTRRGNELRRDAEHTHCDLVLYEPHFAELAAGIAAEDGLRTLDLTSDAYQAELARVASGTVLDTRTSGLEPGTLLMLVFTSGTSGRPKAVRMTHRKFVLPGAQLAQRFLTAEDSVYLAMPLFHSGALLAAYAPALHAGATIVLRRKFSASGLLPDVRHYGCTYLHYVGKALSYVLTTPPGPDDADNPLRVAFGNEAAAVEQERFARRFGCRVVDGFGSTENAITVSASPDMPAGSLGRPASGVKVLDTTSGQECPPARFDRQGRLLNPDEAIGELVNTEGTGQFEGYYNDTEADAERIRDGMYFSGDYAYTDEAGFVFFVGRGVDRIRVDGENFGASLVESALAGLPGVAQLAAYGVPDAASGDQVMVCLVMADGVRFDAESFARFVRECRDMSPKWVPRYVRVTGTMPATPSNKILKRPLAAQRWHTNDPVWLRPEGQVGRELAYRPMTGDDAAALAAEFDRHGRSHLLEPS